jgi:hypothetical protein
VAAIPRVGVTGDIVDLALRPTGINDFGDNDGQDGSANWMVVSTTLPSNPTQPDGTIFVPVDSADTDNHGIPDAWERIYFATDLTKLSTRSERNQGSTPFRGRLGPIGIPAAGL